MLLLVTCNMPMYTICNFVCTCMFFSNNKITKQMIDLHQPNSQVSPNDIPCYVLRGGTAFLKYNGLISTDTKQHVHTKIRLTLFSRIRFKISL